MVTIPRAEFDRKLNSIASVLSPTAKKYPLLGLIQGGKFRLWQDGDMPIWNTSDIDTDENFSFSVLISDLRDIVNRFKTESVDLMSDERGSIVVKSGRSKVKIPYTEGIYDEIPDTPTLETKCVTDSNFLNYLSLSKDFIARTYEQASLTYSYIGSSDGDFLISAMNGFSSFMATASFDGETLPDVVVPSEFANAVSRLLSSSDTVEVGLSYSGNHVVMSNDVTTIYTPRIKQTYPNIVQDMSEGDGTTLFNVNKKSIVDQMKVALQTTNQDLVGIEPLEDGTGLQLSIPRSNLEANLIVEDVNILQPFECSYFQLPFLIQTLDVFSSDRINIEILPKYNNIFRMSSDDISTITTIRPHILPNS